MVHPASFKDPAGFMFQSGGNWYRQVNLAGKNDFDLAWSSGLIPTLIQQGKLLHHQIIKENLLNDPSWYSTLLPRQLNRISYPYEWSFGQLKDAALLTLDICRQALDQGSILKDATPFNIQYLEGKPVFIDILSFTKYDESKPWVAYRQFCENFLFPLLLEKYRHCNTREWLRIYLDGIPLEVTAGLLPWKSRLNPSVAMHVFLQNRVAKSKPAKENTGGVFSKQKLIHLLSHLESMIRGLQSERNTTWANYYTETILDPQYLEEKSKLVASLLKPISHGTLLDLGANDGYFSIEAARLGWEVVASDFDDACIDRLYTRIKKERIKNILPIVNDISNPSPSLGFAHLERASFQERMGSDLVMALALIHHLVIGKNIPLSRLAAYFAGLGKYLLIEFVPKEDEKTRILLSHKEDIYPLYTKEGFEKAFEENFIMLERRPIPGTHRILYTYQRKSQ